METEWPRVTTTTAVEHPICEANEPWKHIARAERALWFIRAGPKRNRNLPTTPLRLTPSPLSVRNVSGVQCTSNSTSAADFFVVHLLRFLPSFLPCLALDLLASATGFRPKLCGRSLRVVPCLQPRAGPQR